MPLPNPLYPTCLQCNDISGVLDCRGSTPRRLRFHVRLFPVGVDHAFTSARTVL